MFGARTFQNSEATRVYYGTLVYHDLSLGEDTRKSYADGVLKVNLARFSKFAVQVKVQGRQFELVTEQLGNEKAMCAVSASLCASAFINDFYYANEDDKYSQSEKSLLADSRFQIQNSCRTDYKQRIVKSTPLE